MNKTKLFLLGCISLLAFCGSSYAGQKDIKKTINDNCAGYIESLPAGYGYLKDKTYPTIIAIHGLGQLGSDLKKIHHNLDGVPSTIRVNGQSYSFIIILPQFKKWPKPNDVEAVLNFIEANYQVDKTRIYLTGQSMGGGATWDFAGANEENAYRLAAIAPVCGASHPSANRCKVIASSALPVWAFHNADDPTVKSQDSIEYVKKINALNPRILAKLTLSPKGGHDAWTKAYDSKYREGNLNLYEWFLQFDNVERNKSRASLLQNSEKKSSSNTSEEPTSNDPNQTGSESTAH